MRLSSIHLTNYRNYEELILEFPKSLNLFLGENAQGKTNVLESIYVLAMARSHRTNNEKELILWGKDFARLEGRIEKNKRSVNLEMIISGKGKKTKINHLEQKKLSDYVGNLNVILFAPEDLFLVKGSPQNRRKFIDMELGQINPLYLHYLSQYKTILKQRNSYLKQIKEMKQPDFMFLDILSEQLIEFGSLVIKERMTFIKELERWAQAIHEKITYQKEQLSICYQSNIPLQQGDSLENIQSRFKEALNKSKKSERYQQNTMVGPHRDDLHFLINSNNVQIFGSQGQQRTVALSMKLAEIDLIHQETGEYPILLLDDVLSELDNQRQLHLLEAIEGKVQTFLTATGLEAIGSKLTIEPDIFYVEHGTIRKDL